MTDKSDSIRQATERVLQLEGELEAEGAASTQGDELALARAMLHQWVDSVVAVSNASYGQMFGCLLPERFGTLPFR